MAYLDIAILIFVNNTHLKSYLWVVATLKCMHKLLLEVCKTNHHCKVALHLPVHFFLFFRWSLSSWQLHSSVYLKFVHAWQQYYLFLKDWFAGKYQMLHVSLLWFFLLRFLLHSSWELSFFVCVSNWGRGSVVFLNTFFVTV